MDKVIIILIVMLSIVLYVRLKNNNININKIENMAITNATQGDGTTNKKTEKSNFDFAQKYIVNTTPETKSECQNESIKNKYSYKQLDTYKRTDGKILVGCSDYSEAYDEDIAKFYSSKIKKIKSYLEEPGLRGYNIYDESLYSDMNNIGRINLTNKNNPPDAINSVKNLMK